jgi:hypothetical protein
MPLMETTLMDERLFMQEQDGQKKDFQVPADTRQKRSGRGWKQLGAMGEKKRGEVVTAANRKRGSRLFRF